MTVLFGNGEIWTKPNVRVPRMLSILLHVTLVTLALIPWAVSPKLLPKPSIDLALYVPASLILPFDESHGGGGGGRHQPNPASLGRLPRAADRQMTPPDPEPPKNPDPTLIVEQTVVAPQLASLPQLNLLSIGDPNGPAGPPSAGPGTGYGIGKGDGHGVGDDIGPGVGPGEGGGFGGEAFHIGAGISKPVLLHEILPEYSEEARKARYQGTVILNTIVLKDGSVQVLNIAHALGFGLDQKAIAAVLQWKFKPAHRNGEPVPSYLTVEVSFNLR